LIEQTEQVQLMSKEEINKSQYNYPHFRPEFMVERFEGGPKPSELRLTL
jgi:hypothetical protein